MTRTLARRAAAAALILALAGCSSPQKKSKGTPASAASGGSPFMASTEKVQKDLGQTEADFSELESQLK